MNKKRQALEREVIVAGRESGISNVLFRNLISSTLGLNITDMECLDLLFHRKIASPSELAHYTGLSSGATTAMLDRLEKSGLITRRPNPNDRRGTIIEVVPEAAEKISPLFHSVRLAQTELLKGYSDEELLLLAAHFKRAMRMWETERIKLRDVLHQ